MDAQSGSQATQFKPGVSPNPGGTQRGAAYHELYTQLVAELGCEPTVSQRLLIQRIVEAHTGKHKAKTPAATVARLLKQLGLPAKKVEKSAGPSLADHVRQTYGDR
jgi:hypothetical protein